MQRADVNVYAAFICHCKCCVRLYLLIPRADAIRNAVCSKVNGLKEVYSPKLLEPTSPRCQVIVLIIMSRCINFAVFSFVMMSNNKKNCMISECYVDSIV